MKNKLNIALFCLMSVLGQSFAGEEDPFSGTAMEESSASLNVVDEQTNAQGDNDSQGFFNNALEAVDEEALVFLTLGSNGFNPGE